MPESAAPQRSKGNKSANLHQLDRPEPASLFGQTDSGLEAQAVQRAKLAPDTLTPANVIYLQRTIGNQAVAQLLRPEHSAPKVQRVPSALIQRALTVGPADDVYEREADEISRQVVQRAAADEEDDDLMMSRDEEVQRVVGPEGGAVGRELESQIKSSKGGGSPLSSSVRSKVEPKLNANLGPVRVHTGHKAVQMNKELGAKAFTSGKDIFVGGGGSPNDAKLMAHEATHTIQQQAIRQGTLQTARGGTRTDEEQ